MSLVDDLTRLAELHLSGTLTETEYSAAKARLIAAELVPVEPPPTPVDPPRVSTPLVLDAPPTWMKPWGWFLVWIGALGFGASVYIHWRAGSEEAALMSGLLNPMFFIGMPIGLYWLKRTGEVSRVGSPVIRAANILGVTLIILVAVLSVVMLIGGLIRF